jgi:hypothetical protein
LSRPYPSPDPTAIPEIRIENLLAEGGADAPGRLREGLPPSFRMRADAHYVEQLDSPRSSAETTPRTSAGRQAAPAAADPIGVISSELERSLLALGICANMLGDSAPALARLAAANLIRAEVNRALCLLQASRVLRDDVVIRRASVDGRTLVERVLQSVEPERRLRAISIDRQPDVSSCRVAANEELLASALAGLLLVVFDLLEGLTEPRLVLTTHSDGDFVLSVAVDGRRALPAWMMDANAEARGARVDDGRAVLLLATRRIVERCEGRLAVVTTEHGSEIRVSIPRLKG